jgi:hypothetical protein
MRELRNYISSVDLEPTPRGPKEDLAIDQLNLQETREQI